MQMFLRCVLNTPVQNTSEYYPHFSIHTLANGKYVCDDISSKHQICVYRY